MNIDKITVFRINDITTLILRHLQMKQNYLNQLLIQYTNDLNILKSIQKMDLDVTKIVEELSFAIEDQVFADDFTQSKPDQTTIPLDTEFTEANEILEQYQSKCEYCTSKSWVFECIQWMWEFLAINILLRLIWKFILLPYTIIMFFASLPILIFKLWITIL